MVTKDDSRWPFLALAGGLSVCCLGTATLVGGASVSGTAAATTAATSGGVGSLAGLLVVGLATAVPLLAVSLFLRWRVGD